MSVLIVGAGIAGATVAAMLRTKGYAGAVTLIGGEPGVPYQRPPLSKDHLVDEAEEPQLVRPAAFWADKDIDLITGVHATAIDRDARSVTLADGRTLDYEHLVLATGARNRELPGADGALALRTLEEGRELRARLVAPGARLVVVGGGFIGLEVASGARELGAEVTVVEALDRVMARVVSVPMSRWFEARHAEAGVELQLARRVERIHAGGVTLDGGEEREADVVLVAVGVVPETELAQAAGLEVADGIVVDEHLTTSDPAISAVGDCARFPAARGHHRLESIQNATDQARTVAARLAGEAEPYEALPWFWSDQLGHKLQIAGVAAPDAEAVVRGEAAPEGGFSIGLFVDGRLEAVETVDRMPDHMAARKLLSAGTPVTAEQFADTGVALKELAAT